MEGEKSDDGKGVLLFRSIIIPRSSCRVFSRKVARINSDIRYAQ